VIALAQVLDTFPEEHAVQVLFRGGSWATQPGPNGASQSYRCRVLTPRAHPVAGVVELPQPGDWGVVAFLAGGADSQPVWMGCLFDDLRNILAANTDPVRHLDHHPSDVWSMIEGNGNITLSHPSGTTIRLATDQTIPARSRYVRGDGVRQEEPFEVGAQPEQMEVKPPIFVELKHSTGTVVTIEPTGKIVVHGVDDGAVTIDGDLSVDVTGTSANGHPGAATVNVAGDAAVTVGGAASVTAASGITLDGGSGNATGAVTQACICAFTGAPHPDYSANVVVSK